MSVLIVPAISAVTGLLGQKTAERMRKLASDVAQAQSANSLADQSYLMVVQRSGSNPPTRYEYDKATAPYASAVQTGDIDTLRQVGLWTDAYIASVAAQHPRVATPTLSPQPGIPLPPGASVQAPVIGPGVQPSALPSWALPVGIAAGGLLLLMMMRKGKS